MKEVTVILLLACSHCVYLKSSYHNMILTHILKKKKKRQQKCLYQHLDIMLKIKL